MVDHLSLYLSTLKQFLFTEFANENHDNKLLYGCLEQRQNNKLMGKLTDLLIFLPIFWTFTGLFHFHNGDKILVVLTLISALISAIKYNKTIITYNLKSRYIWMMYGLLLISIIADYLDTYNPINVRAIAIVCVLLTFFPYQLITRNALIITTLLGSINSLLFVYKFTYLTPVDRYGWPINAIPFATYICFITTISFILLLTSNTIKDKITLILTLVISIISLALTETRGALLHYYRLYLLFISIFHTTENYLNETY
ncbi:hypothetical protein ACP5PY_03095 [Photobacterium leiognathi subsp. mandapamensis]